MPSVYAHYRFGRDIYELLPEKAKYLATKHRELFDIGLQGPDILFFYHPIWHNYVNRLGHHIHSWQGAKFFQAAIRVIRNHTKNDPLIAYICGVTCHYALDLVCHPCVDYYTEHYQLEHSAIEGSFERALIVEDNLPLNTLVTTSLKLSPKNAEIIQHFYGRTTGKQIFRALRCMVWCNDALRMKDNIIKKGLFLFLRLIGKYDKISGMVITAEPLPEFAESDIELRKRYNAAKPVALMLINELLNCIESGKSLSKQFSATFSG